MSSCCMGQYSGAYSRPQAMTNHVRAWTRCCEEEEVREGEACGGLSQLAAPLSLVWQNVALGTVGAQICPDISEEHKGPLSLASNIIEKWWKVWMATVDISAGVHMKQKGSKRYNVKEGVRGGYATSEGLQWALRQWRHEIIEGKKKPLENHVKLFGFLSVLICCYVWVSMNI